VSAAYAPHYERLTSSGLYRAAVDAGLLLPHEVVPPDQMRYEDGAYAVLRPELVPFVSHPYEWSFQELKDAALLTLALQRRALEHDLSLKDASAYNVQFRGATPVFIDTLSFEIYRPGTPWVGYQQFCKHFLAPLALVAYRHPGLAALLRANIDGIPLDLTSRLLPARTWAIPSLLTHVHLHALSLRRYADTSQPTRAAATGLSKNGLLGLVDSLESAIRRLQWRPGGTEWADYYDATNYSGSAGEHKATVVAEMLAEVAPRSVWDLGANTGRYSRIASRRGCLTIAFDVDAAAVDRNYRACRRDGEDRLLPLVMDVTNPSPDLGWDHDERASLARRGPADLVMALALVHHLAIGNNVPLDRIAAALRRLGGAVLIEFVPKGDSQVARLLARREDIFPDYTEAAFERAFAAHFALRRKVAIRDSSRTLYLWTRDPA
jgi:ribosomal protein L11 methylase PrmA